MKTVSLSLWYFLVVLVFGGIYSGLAFLWGVFIWWQAAMFVGGLVAGMALLTLDKNVLYRYYTEDQTVPQLMTRSLIFLLALIPLSLFVVTSSGSLIGSGLILGLVAGLVGEMRMLRGRPDEFRAVFLSQLKRDVSPEEIRNLVIGSGIFLILIAGLFFI